MKRPFQEKMLKWVTTDRIFHKSSLMIFVRVFLWEMESTLGEISTRVLEILEK